MAPNLPSAGSAPLPPLPDLSASGGQGNPAGGSQQPMAALMSGLAPIKTGVDAILAACKSIVQSGTIPGSEQVCGQIVALATSLLPMAAQQVLQPGGQASSGVPPVGA